MAIIAAGSTACDPSNSLSTAAKVKQAFDKLGKQKSLSLEIGFDANADQIFKAMQGQDDFTRDDAAMLAKMKLDYSFGSDTALKDAKADDKSFKYGMQLGESGKPVLEARQLDNKSYFRVDLKAVMAFAEKHGKKPGSGDAEGKAMEKLIRQADQLPDSLGGAKNALKGEWVSLDKATLEEFAKSMDKSGSGKSTQPDPETQKKVYEVLQRALVDNAEVKDAGKKNGVEHVTATVPANKVAKDFAEGLKPLKDKLGAKAPSLDKLDKDLDELDKKKDKNLVFDLSIKDGMLAGLSLDAAQFNDDAKGEDKLQGPLPIAITFKDGAAALTAPAGAKELKPQDLMGAAMFAMGAGKDGKDV
ncbi:hypothetical protein [Streptomyces sp. NPDC049555]|uniref:hypothetical protein n=1 Tax=unclassified Streptomyces TaxID=2593676 RepID=UPI003414418F